MGSVWKRYKNDYIFLLLFLLTACFKSFPGPWGHHQHWLSLPTPKAPCTLPTPKAPMSAPGPPAHALARLQQGWPTSNSPQPCLTWPLPCPTRPAHGPTTKTQPIHWALALKQFSQLHCSWPGWWGGPRVPSPALLALVEAPILPNPRKLHAAPWQLLSHYINALLI